MRLAALFLLTLATAVAPAAQTVSTITFASTQSMDGLYVDPSGQLFATGGYLGDDVYAVTLDGGLSVFSTGFDGPIHLTQAPNGTYYVTDFTPSSATAGTVSEVTPDGQRSVLDDVPAGPSDIVADADGTLYVSHYGGLSTADGDSITRIEAGGKPEPYTAGGLLSAPVGLDFGDDGTLYAANIFDGRVVAVAPDGAQSLVATLPLGDGPFAVGHMVWANGRLYATHLSANQVVAVEPDGRTTVVAGSGVRAAVDGPALEAAFDRPNGIAASVTGDTLYVSEFTGSPLNRLRMITGVLATVNAEAPAEAAALRLESSPNPFARETTLRFRLGAPADVSLVVMDLLGRVVERRAVGARAAGAQSVTWAPEGLAPGTYVVRLQAGAATATHTVVRSR